MATVEDATRCIAELNGAVGATALLLCFAYAMQDLNGRRIRVDYSVTDRPHAPTPGEYMGHRRTHRDTYYREPRDRDRNDRNDREYRRGDRDRYDRDRDLYGRDRDWRDRRSPPRRYSPEYRRRRSYSRSPPRGGASPRREYEPPAPADPGRWP